MSSTTASSIVISSLDADRLHDLLMSQRNVQIPGIEALQAELDRANVVEPDEIPPTVVTMNSTVRFSIQDTAEVFHRTLVYPKDLDDSGERLSILAPVGSALLGLSQGDEIDWPGPGGGTIKVRIDEVTYQPERAGDLHR